MPNLKWKDPKAVPSVEVGTEENFWIAVFSRRSKKVYVFLALYQNRPVCSDRLEEDHCDCEKGAHCSMDDALHSDEGIISSVGWVQDKEHEEYSSFYVPYHFSDDYKLLGWADYEPPEYPISDEDLESLIQ